MRNFANQSVLLDGNLALSIAPALTPNGLENNPIFFDGYILYPQIFSRGLLVLADVTATRYFKYVPVTERDPVLTAQGDRIRAECFSACNGVYARFDVFKSGLEGEIGYGTTNVDIGANLRKSLTQVKQSDKLLLKIGTDGLASTSVSEVDENTLKVNETIEEKPVNMPDRWVRALGNTSQIHKTMTPVFTLNKIQSQMFISTLPPVTGKEQNGWLTQNPKGVKLMPLKSKNSVYIAGLHRLSALKRVMTDITEMTFYSNDEIEGHCMVDVELKSARLTLSLTAESWQGYSGEGSLLTALASSDVIDDVEEIMPYLEFNAVIDQLQIAEKYKLSKERVEEALTFLAVSGKLGYDVRDKAYFHRELPHDPKRVLKDNPRLISARKLVENVERLNDTQWSIVSNDTEYRVNCADIDNVEEAKCTCTWYLKHKNNRGPCKHILAVQLREGKYGEEE